MPAQARQQRLALWTALALVCVWSVSFTVQKIAYTAMTPGAFLFLRSTLLGLCALLLLRARGMPLWPRLQREEWGPFMRLVLVGPVLHITVTTFGIHLSTAFSSALIMASGPVFTLLLQRWLGGTRVTRSQAFGVAVSFTGVLLYMGEKFIGANWRAGLGDLLVLAGAATFSLYTVWVAPFVARHGGVQMYCWTTVTATPLLMLITAPAFTASTALQVGPTIWAAFAWAVLIGAFLGWMAWGWVNAVRGVSRTAPLMYLIPPVAGLFSWAVGGEPFAMWKVVGALIVLGGVAWTQFGARALAWRRTRAAAV